MRDLDDLVSRGPVLLDGAWGTSLQAVGLRVGERPDRWNLDHPDRVEALAREYAEAGSRIVLTNTFGANELAWSEGAASLDEVNRRGVQLSRAGVDGRCLVYAAVGPSGVAPGAASEATLRRAFERQVAALAAEGPDGLVVESMTDPREALIAVGAARATGLPVVASFAVAHRDGRDPQELSEVAAGFAREMLRAGVVAVGANCTVGVEAALVVCEAIVGVSDRPVWMKPSAGLPEMLGARPVYRLSPEELAERVVTLVRSGAALVGGCCGTGPAHIAAAARRLAGGI